MDACTKVRNIRANSPLKVLSAGEIAGVAALETKIRGLPSPGFLHVKLMVAGQLGTAESVQAC